MEHYIQELNRIKEGLNNTQDPVVKRELVEQFQRLQLIIQQTLAERHAEIKVLEAQNANMRAALERLQVLQRRES